MNQLRRERIGKYIQEKGAVTVKEVSALFPDVSLMTIHRDLEKLEEEGLIIRTRGGAVSATSAGSPTEVKLEGKAGDGPEGPAPAGAGKRGISGRRHLEYGTGPGSS